MAEPLPPNVQNKPNPNSLDGTPAGDDRQDNPQVNAKTAGPLGSKENPAPAAFAGQTQAGEANVPPVITITAKRPNKPGKRPNNPLSKFSSYTYQLSLYMITPDAHNAFLESGRRNINALTATDSNGNPTNGGAFLIAQSGGINNKTSKRAPEFDLDYYIDDLKIRANISTNVTQSAANVTQFTFNIYEPYGFSFISNLKKAREQLIQNSKIRNYEEAENGAKQFFMLGIRFQGYDETGAVANSTNYFSEDTINTSPDASGVYERFYEILFESVKFKINGTATTYNIVAKSAGDLIGLGTAYGTIDNMIPITAGTVEEALLGDGDGITSLIKTLNETQKALENEGSISRANEYDIKFIGDTTLLKNASLISKADTDKKKQGMGPADNANEVNEGTAVKAVPDKNKKIIQIAKGTPILQAINNIIKQSTYMESFLDKVVKSTLEPNSDTNSPDVVVNKKPPPVSWYNISVNLECLEYDPIVNDFAYKITYVIQPYATPASFTPFTRTSRYPGPYKRYEYWFTGQNSEILNYEQKMDNTYFTVDIDPGANAIGTDESSGQNSGLNTNTGSTNVPRRPNKKNNQDSQGRLDVGMEAQNSYMTSLYDPGSYAASTITILGDPDYLTQEISSSLSTSYNQYYGEDGFSINPNGGQVFIEIDFKEGIDYSNKNGLMNINDSILFWRYPDDVANKIKGISYQVWACESVFRSGKFTQTLLCIINDIPEEEEESQISAGRSATSDNENTGGDTRTGGSQGGSGPTPSSGSNTSGSSGMPKDKPVPVSTVPTSPVVSGTLPPPQRTNTNGVVNDDSSQPPTSTQNGGTNSQSPDAGREVPPTTLIGSRPGEGA